MKQKVSKAQDPVLSPGLEVVFVGSRNNFETTDFLATGKLGITRSAGEKALIRRSSDVIDCFEIPCSRRRRRTCCGFHMCTKNPRVRWCVLSEENRVVGPPSEELNCFDAMKLRMRWSAAESPPPQLEFIAHVSSTRIRHVHCQPLQFKTCRLRDEQNCWCFAYLLQPTARQL
jgi:hypothetical protein